MSRRLPKFTSKLYNPFTPRCLDRSIFDFPEALFGDTTAVNFNALK